MAAEQTLIKRRSRHSKTEPKPLIVRIPWLVWLIGILGLMAAAFLAGWFIALGPVNTALRQLHQDIQAEQAHRPLVIHPLNLWSALGGFVLGMLVMTLGNRWLRPRPANVRNEKAPVFRDDDSEEPVPVESQDPGAFRDAIRPESEPG